MTQAASPGERLFTRLRALGVVRPDKGRWVAGVCAGLAHRWGLDPLLVRGLFVVVSVVSGFGLGLYGLAWLFLPHPDGRIHAQQALRGVVTAGCAGAVVFTLIGLPLSGGAWSAQGPVNPSGSLGFLAVVGLVTWWLVNRHSSRPPVPGTPRPSAPPAPAVAIASRKVDVRRPLRTLTLTTYGVALLAFAAVVSWDRWIGHLPNAGLVSGAAALGVVALGILLAGILGHRSGGLIPLALLLAVMSINGAAWQGMWHHPDARSVTWAPTAATAATGYDLDAGHAVLDLTGPGLLTGATSASPVTVPASIGVGELVVVVPKGASSRVNASVGLGAITDRVTGGKDYGGAGVKRTIPSGTDPVLVVTAEVGLGHVEVVPQGTEVNR